MGLNNIKYEVVCWVHLAQDGDKLSDSIKASEFLDQLNNNLHFKRDSVL
jgi:hypothetical protein